MKEKSAAVAPSLHAWQATGGSAGVKLSEWLSALWFLSFARRKPARVAVAACAQLAAQLAARQQHENLPTKNLKKKG
jgi:hypothetical protein